MKRYRDLIFIDKRAKKHPTLPVLANMHIEVECEDCGYPEHGHDECYNLTVGSTNVIKAKTVWGALRGLETFSQTVFENAAKEILVNQSEIRDWPRYSLRANLLGKKTGNNYFRLF